MKLIIDIPDDVYESVKETKTINTIDYATVSLYRAIKNGKSYTDKISSEDFIKAFGGGVKQMENVKPIVIDCQYYLPCGRCDKTNGFCSQLDGIEFPAKPNVTISPDNPFYAPVNNGGITPV